MFARMLCVHGVVGVQVQRTIGVSDYVRRDIALKNLIQPLAGEYGMHNNQPQRECVSGYASVQGWEARPPSSLLPTS